MGSHSRLLHEETKGQSCSKAAVQLTQGPVGSRGNTGKNGPGTVAGKLMRLETRLQGVEESDKGSRKCGGGPARAQGLGAQRRRTETGKYGDFRPCRGLRIISS